MGEEKPHWARLTLHVLKERSYFSLQRSACVPLSLRTPAATFILLLSITAVKTNPRPSEELSLDLREHPCNYIYLNRGQILAPTREQGLLHFPARENLRSMCVCAKYILQAWNNCEESAELESLFTRQTFASTFQIRFQWSFWTVPDLWKWDRFPFFLICSSEKNFFHLSSNCLSLKLKIKLNVSIFFF